MGAKQGSKMEKVNKKGEPLHQSRLGQYANDQTVKAEEDDDEAFLMNVDDDEEIDRLQQD
jgi:hypothetical protein